MAPCWPVDVLRLLLPLAATLLPAATTADAAPTCTLVGDLLQHGSTRGTNLTPEGLGGEAGATPEGCQAACCAQPLCVAFTQNLFQETATENCVHGEPCCWLKAGYVPIPGTANETAGQVHRTPNTASPASVPIRVLTEVTILHTGGTPVANLTAGDRAVCTLAATSGGWARDEETFGNGVVLNASAVRCKVNATAELGGLASLRAVSV
jgi:hypothetical protein